jgi:hypothetical protein
MNATVRIKSRNQIVKIVTNKTYCLASIYRGDYQRRIELLQGTHTGTYIVFGINITADAHVDPGHLRL